MKDAFPWDRHEDFARSFKDRLAALDSGEEGFALDFILGLSLADGLEDEIAAGLDIPRPAGLGAPRPLFPPSPASPLSSGGPKGVSSPAAKEEILISAPLKFCPASFVKSAADKSKKPSLKSPGKSSEEPRPEESFTGAVLRFWQSVRPEREGGDGSSRKGSAKPRDGVLPLGGGGGKKTRPPLKALGPFPRKRLLVPFLALFAVLSFSAVRVSDGPPPLKAGYIFAPEERVPPSPEASSSAPAGARNSAASPSPDQAPPPEAAPSLKLGAGDPAASAGETLSFPEKSAPKAAPAAAPLSVSGSLPAPGPQAATASSSRGGGEAGGGLTRSAPLEDPAFAPRDGEKTPPPKGEGSARAAGDPLRIVRTVAWIPEDEPGYRPKRREAPGEAPADPDSEAVLENDEEEDLWTGEAFGGGDADLAALGEGELPAAPSAGETTFSPEPGADLGGGPGGDGLPAGGSRVVKVIGYIPGSPLDKETIAGFLGRSRITGLDSGFLELREPSTNEVLYLKTTFDRSLQREAEKWVAAAGALDAALVVMDPLDGRVLALAGRESSSDANPAVAGSFPAASVFKIVTAARAMDLNGYDRNSYVLFDGGRHTLFRSNVVKEPDSGRHKATLEEGFAHSINSVFGKLGIYTLGPEELRQAAELFRFNSPIIFEMEVAPSSFVLEDKEDSFLLAELASGYNRTTKASPLHAAMLAAAVYNEGRMMEPFFVEEATDGRGSSLYRGAPRSLGEAVSAETARELLVLMRAAVYEGTGRKRFFDALTHPVLKDLELGGKSGTINDTEGNSVDWFVALSKIRGKDGKEARPLAVAAVIVHNGRVRLSSQELARRAVLNYYKSGRSPGV